MIDSSFLETSPLYRTVPYEAVGVRTGSRSYDQVTIVSISNHLPPVTMHCPKCQSIETFRFDSDRKKSSIYPSPNIFKDVLEGVFSVYYLCASCQQQEICFFLRFYDGKVAKVGQSPSPYEFLDTPTSIKKALAGELETYRKGLMNESVGFGIGAFAYYRRIVENHIDDLLTEISSIASEEYQVAIKTIKDSHNVSERIKIVKDLLPDSLRANGINPLSLIYNVLSVGIHERSDEDCLSHATALRQVFTCLVEGLHYTKGRDRDYALALSKLKSVT